MNFVHHITISQRKYVNLVSIFKKLLINHLECHLNLTRKSNIAPLKLYKYMV